ncbi:MAG TPA: hypothetical protein VFC17_06980 [Candidatus Limnocylindrales bacterium]|nr:hypothetical protein [Candidatus Limnocylindrales bacterium]
MNKKLAIFLIIAAFLIGSIIGHQIASRKYEKIIQISSENVASGYANNSVWLLNVLRTNNTAKAIENLEMNLDWELIDLNYSMSNAPASPLNPYFYKSIQRAKEYRSQFPYKSDSRLEDEAVSNIFLHVNALTNK